MWNAKDEMVVDRRQQLLLAPAEPLLSCIGLAFWAVSKVVSFHWGLRWALCMFIGGLLGYNYLALGLPGAANWIATDAGAIGVLMLTFGGEVLGGIGAWIWMLWFSEPASRAD